jgi:hypothetical protein
VPLCSGQWSDDPAANLAIADRSGPQVEPKLVAIADGGFYLSWFDNATGGYDIYLQRLDAAGVEQWPHNGVLVADRGYDGTQGYGLAVDTAGHALLAFNDDRSGTDEITVVRVDPDGNLVWGPSGVQVSAVGAVYSPRVAGTSDGNIVVAWTSDDSVVLQKVAPSGMALWGAGVTLSPSYAEFFVADLKASDAGSAIVSWVHSDFPTATNHLWAQKLAADGALLWGAGHVPVFDSGSLQMGNSPPFSSDGAGGAVFAWYSSVPLQCRVQRILANGSEAFAHQGVEVSIAARNRVNPSAIFLPASEELVVFWKEENVPEQFGLYGQKLDAAGVRQWTDSGRELVPIGDNEIDEVVTLPFADGAVVAWKDSFDWENEPIRATRVDSNGDFVWATPIVDLASSPTGNTRLAGALSAVGFAAFTWVAGDVMSSDILAQNLNGDGSLGSSVVFADGFESGDTASWSATAPQDRACTKICAAPASVRPSPVDRSAPRTATRRVIAGSL